MIRLPPHRLLITCFTFVIVFDVNALAFAQDTAKKAAVPDDAAQAKAEKTIKDVYKAEYAKRKPADLKALASKLLEKAPETKLEDLASRFVLLREACDLAAQGGDAVTALRAIDETAKEFAIDAVEMKMTALEVASKAAVAVVEQRGLAENAFLLVDDAVAADQYDAALRLLVMADLAARKSSKLLVARVEARDKEVRLIRKEYEQLKPQFETLKKKADDPEAKLAIGKFQCFTKGNWEQGLPLLAACSDAALQTLAMKDLAELTEAKEQAELADGWWEMAEKQTGLPRKHLMLRAGHWYEMALNDLTGLAKEKAEQRLDKMPGPLSVFLCDMKEVKSSVGYGEFGKKGELGYGNGDTRIQVQGKRSPHGLSFHPPNQGYSYVTYKLGKKYDLFTATVAMNGNNARSASPVRFMVLANGKLLWRSGPMQNSGDSQVCRVSMVGVDQLELRVMCTGAYQGADAVWLEPQVTKTNVEK